MDQRAGVPARHVERYHRLGGRVRMVRYTASCRDLRRGWDLTERHGNVGGGGHSLGLSLLLEACFHTGLPVTLPVVDEPVGQLLQLDAGICHDLRLFLLSRVWVRDVLRTHHPGLQVVYRLRWETR